MVNQKLSIKDHIIQWSKEKWKNDNLQNITRKTKDGATQTQLKTEWTQVLRKAPRLLSHKIMYIVWRKLTIVWVMSHRLGCIFTRSNWWQSYHCCNGLLFAHLSCSKYWVRAPVRIWENVSEWSATCLNSLDRWDVQNGWYHFVKFVLITVFTLT